MAYVRIGVVFSLALFSSWGRSLPVDDQSNHDDIPIIPINQIFPGIIEAQESGVTSVPWTRSDPYLPSIKITEITSSNQIPSQTSAITASSEPSLSPMPSLSIVPRMLEVEPTSSSSTTTKPLISSTTEQPEILSTQPDTSSITTKSVVISSTAMKPEEISSTTTKPKEILSTSKPTTTPSSSSSSVSAPRRIIYTSTKTPTPLIGHYNTIIVVNSSQPVVVNASNMRSRNRTNTSNKPVLSLKAKSSNETSGQRLSNKPVRGRTPDLREQNVPKNTCDLCKQSCKKNNKPICTKPVGEGEVDPDKLRGFPSTCHMDCFNVCRKIRYEKVTDGRCGRLKNRIRPIGSKNKLTRSELDKTQYKLDSSDEQLFFFSPLDV